MLQRPSDLAAKANQSTPALDEAVEVPAGIEQTYNRTQQAGITNRFPRKAVQVKDPEKVNIKPSSTSRSRQRHLRYAVNSRKPWIISTFYSTIYPRDFLVTMKSFQSD